MVDKPFDAEAHVEAMAAAVGLVIDAAHRPGVIRYVQFLAGMYGRLTDFPMPEALEPAPQFKP